MISRRAMLRAFIAVATSRVSGRWMFAPCSAITASERVGFESIMSLADELEQHGTPILIAINRVVERTTNERVRRAFLRVRETIRRGGTFVGGFDLYPDIFPKKFRRVFETDEVWDLSVLLREAANQGWESHDG